MTKPRKQRVSEAMTQLPEGTKVYVRKDDGTEVESVTTSRPWQLGHGDWIVKVEGIGGGYDLERISLRE